MTPRPTLILLYAAWRHAFAHGLAPWALQLLWRNVARNAEFDCWCALAVAHENRAVYDAFARGPLRVRLPL
jgi:hypothetical protein